MTVDESVECEQARWQDAIYAALQMHVPDVASSLDGSGCDSGDPLDVTLAEIAQAINFIKDQNHESIKAVAKLA